MRRSLMLVRSLVVRDLQLFWSDRRAAMFCFLVPILLGSLFGMIFDNPTRRMGKMKLPICIVVEDSSPTAREIVEDLKRSENLEANFVDRATAEADLASRRIGVALVIPEGFGNRAIAQLRRGEKPTLQLLHHPLSAMESEWADGVLTEVLIKRFAKEIFGPLLKENRLDRPFQLEKQTFPSSAASKFNSYSHSFCGMMLQYLLFWGMESGLLFLREQRRGIWNRLRIAPLPMSVTLCSRVASTTFIGIAQMLVTFGFAYWAFGVTIEGSATGFLLMVLSVSLFAAVTGLLVATMSGTEARARNICILLILALSMLGGLWLPLFLLPPWVQELSLSLPTTWAMRGLDGVTWQGFSLAELLPCIGAVGGFTILALGLAAVRFYRMERLFRRGANA